jgi:hypothetical protein
MTAIKTVTGILTAARCGAWGGGRGDAVPLSLGDAKRLLDAGEISVPDADERAAALAFVPAPVDPVDPAPGAENASADQSGVETAAKGAAKKAKGAK